MTDSDYVDTLLDIVEVISKYANHLKVPVEAQPTLGKLIALNPAFNQARIQNLKGSV